MGQASKVIIFFLYCCYGYCWAETLKQIHYTIEGVSSEILENINNTITPLKEAYIKQQITNTIYQKELKEQVINAITPYGFYHPYVRITHTKGKKSEYTNIKITLGSQVIITSMKVHINGHGANSPSLNNVLKYLPSKKGNAFNSIEYEQSKDLISSWAINNGYINGDFMINQVKLNVLNNTAEIILIYDTKEQFFFGDTTMSKSKLNHELLTKYLGYRKGDVFNPNGIVNSYLNLSNSDFFKFVNIIPNFENQQDNAIPITIELKENQPIKLAAGIGYDTDVLFNTQLSAQHRIINSRGHSLLINGQYNENIITVNCQYLMPGIHPSIEQTSIYLKAKKFSISAGTSKSLLTGISWTSKKSKWTAQFGCSNLQESYKIYKDNKQAKKIFILGEYNLQYKQVNNNTFPTVGYRAYGAVIGALKTFLSDNSFVQTKFAIDWIATFKQIRIIQKNTFGVIFFGELPLSLQFLTGGNDSVRAYEFKSLGPGKYLYTNSLDIQIPIYRKIYGLLFYDAGNVTNTAYSHLKQSIGIGLMWNSDIGPINLGIARNLGEKNIKHRFYFSIGIEI